MRRLRRWRKARGQDPLFELAVSGFWVGWGLCYVTWMGGEAWDNGGWWWAWFAFTVAALALFVAVFVFHLRDTRQAFAVAAAQMAWDYHHDRLDPNEARNITTIGSRSSRVFPS